jgi:hypothetical protein
MLHALINPDDMERWTTAAIGEREQREEKEEAFIQQQAPA